MKKRQIKKNNKKLLSREYGFFLEPSFIKKDDGTVELLEVSLLLVN